MTGPVGPLPPSSPEESKKEKKEKTSKSAEVAQKRIKPHEAEDAGILRPKIIRQTSEPDLRQTNLISEKEEIQRKSGGLWECIGRKPNPNGGYIYRFKLKPEYDPLLVEKDAYEKFQKIMEEKQAELFPAYEPSHVFIRFITSDYFMDRFTQLGYKFEDVDTGKDKGYYISLPDKEALTVQWKEFCRKNPQVFKNNPPHFDILSSEGIAGDIDYIEAFLTHDVLLSTGKEFVHDHIAHVILILPEIFRAPEEYQSERFRVAKLINKAYRTILIAQRVVNEGIVKMSSEQAAQITQHLNKMKTTLSIFVDLLPARFLKHTTELELRTHFINIWNKMPSFFWEKELGKDYKAVTNILPTLWTQIKEIEKKFNEKYTEKVALAASQICFAMDEDKSLKYTTALRIVDLKYFPDENKVVVIWISNPMFGRRSKTEVLLKFPLEPGNERILLVCLRWMIAEMQGKL